MRKLDSCRCCVIDYDEFLHDFASPTIYGLVATEAFGSPVFGQSKLAQKAMYERLRTLCRTNADSTQGQERQPVELGQKMPVPGYQVRPQEVRVLSTEPGHPRLERCRATYHAERFRDMRDYIKKGVGPSQFFRVPPTLNILVPGAMVDTGLGPTDG